MDGILRRRLLANQVEVPTDAGPFYQAVYRARNGNMQGRIATNHQIPRYYPTDMFEFTVDDLYEAYYFSNGGNGTILYLGGNNGILQTITIPYSMDNINYVAVTSNDIIVFANSGTGLHTDLSDVIWTYGVTGEHQFEIQGVSWSVQSPAGVMLNTKFGVAIMYANSGSWSTGSGLHYFITTKCNFAEHSYARSCGFSLSQFKEGNYYQPIVVMEAGNNTNPSGFTPYFSMSLGTNLFTPGSIAYAAMGMSDAGTYLGQIGPWIVPISYSENNINWVYEAMGAALGHANLQSSWSNYSDKLLWPLKVLSYASNPTNNLNTYLLLYSPDLTQRADNYLQNGYGTSILGQTNRMYVTTPGGTGPILQYDTIVENCFYSCHYLKNLPNNGNLLYYYVNSEGVISYMDSPI